MAFQSPRALPLYLSAEELAHFVGPRASAHESAKPVVVAALGPYSGESFAVVRTVWMSGQCIAEGMRYCGPEGVSLAAESGDGSGSGWVRPEVRMGALDALLASRELSLRGESSASVQRELRERFPEVTEAWVSGKVLKRVQGICTGIAEHLDLVSPAFRVKRLELAFKIGTHNQVQLLLPLAIERSPVEVPNALAEKVADARYPANTELAAQPAKASPRRRPASDDRCAVPPAAKLRLQKERLIANVERRAIAASASNEPEPKPPLLRPKLHNKAEVPGQRPQRPPLRQGQQEQEQGQEQEQEHGHEEKQEQEQERGEGFTRRRKAPRHVLAARNASTASKRDEGSAAAIRIRQRSDSMIVMTDQAAGYGMEEPGATLMPGELEEPCAFRPKQDQQRWRPPSLLVADENVSTVEEAAAGGAIRPPIDPFSAAECGGSVADSQGDSQCSEHAPVHAPAVARALDLGGSRRRRASTMSTAAVLEGRLEGGTDAILRPAPPTSANRRHENPVRKLLSAYGGSETTSRRLEEWWERRERRTVEGRRRLAKRAASERDAARTRLTTASLAIPHDAAPGSENEQGEPRARRRTELARRSQSMEPPSNAQHASLRTSKTTPRRDPRDGEEMGKSPRGGRNTVVLDDTLFAEPHDAHEPLTPLLRPAVPVEPVAPTRSTRASGASAHAAPGRPSPSTPALTTSGVAGALIEAPARYVAALAAGAAAAKQTATDAISDAIGNMARLGRPGRTPPTAQLALTASENDVLRQALANRSN
jgi:hypothetical protein